MISNDYWPTTSTFSELNEYIDKNIRGTENPFWMKVQENSITKEGIQILIEEGWRLEYGERLDLLSMGVDGMCLEYKKMIKINPELIEYDKDHVICHELVHAIYGTKISDDGFLQPSYQRRLENGSIVEWAGRHMRADPQLLSEILLQFNVGPIIYDKASLMATRGLDENLFNFYDGLYEQNIMDGSINDQLTIISILYLNL